MSAELQAAFGFTAQDLQANQQGHTTRAQAQAAQPPWANLARMALGFGAAVLVFWTVVTVLAPFMVIVWVVLAGALFGGWRAFQRRVYRYRTELESGRVGKLCGSITLREAVRGKSLASPVNYTLSIQGGDFPIYSTAQYRAIENIPTREFCIYYSPETFRILSLEPIGTLPERQAPPQLT